jgi:hypothetical protein
LIKGFAFGWNGLIRKGTTFCSLYASEIWSDKNGPTYIFAISVHLKSGMMRDLRGGIWWEWINKWGTTFYNLSASEIWSKNRDEFLVGGLIRRGTTFYNLSASEIWPKKRDDFLVGGLIRRGTTFYNLSASEIWPNKKALVGVD